MDALFWLIEEEVDTETGGKYWFFLGRLPIIVCRVRCTSVTTLLPLNFLCYRWRTTPSNVYISLNSMQDEDLLDLISLSLSLSLTHFVLRGGQRKSGLGIP